MLGVSTTTSHQFWDRFGGGLCEDQASEAIRLTFHDGIGRSAALQAAGMFGGGGADGSIIQFASVELADPANAGLEDTVYALKHFADAHNVSYGDMIQFAGAVALSNCPGSPRLPFYTRRPAAVAPAPPNLIPAPTDPVERVLARMEDAGFTAEDTVALLAAHSVGTQKTIDPTISNTPFDTTPRVFDSQYYLEILLRGTGYPGRGRSPAEVKSPLKSEFRLTSDAAIARHPKTACAWQSLIGDQDRMRASFSDAMMKLANQGYRNLVDCSSVIPSSRVWDRAPAYPLGKGVADIEQSCPNTPFPRISSQPHAVP
ncbi:heme peroxidase [Sparassis latifolia]